MQRLYLTFKIIVVGQQGIGKTALLYNYIKGEFKEDYNVTIGVEFCSKMVELENSSVNLQIWDTAGQETFQSIVRSFYKGASAVILAYALDNQESFIKLSKWHAEVIEHANQQTCIFLVGTKLDNQKYRQVAATKGQKFLKQIGGALFIETSSKTGENIETLFQMAASFLYRKFTISPKFRDLVNPNSFEQKAQRPTFSRQSFSLKRPPVEEEKTKKKQKKCC